MKLQGKAAVVTGAARGIGLEIARVLLKNGAKVSERISVLRSAVSLSFYQLK